MRHRFNHIQYPEDAQRIQGILLTRFHAQASLSDCESLWAAVSESYSACWMFLPETDDELEGMLMDFVEVVP